LAFLPLNATETFWMARISKGGTEVKKKNPWSRQLAAGSGQIAAGS
jgi:hypothetical protein